MKISESLNILIESTLVDGKVTSREREVLVNKALSEGLDKDEFEIYLDGKIQIHAKTSALKKESRLKAIFNWVIAKKRRVLFIVFLVIPALVNIIGFIGQALYLKSVGCVSVEDCLTQYKFQEAREISSSRWDEEKILKAEIAYFLNSGEKEIAFRSFVEYVPSISGQCTAVGRNDENDYYNQSVEEYNSLVLLMVPYFVDDAQSLNVLVNSLKPKCKLVGSTNKKDTYDHDLYSFEEDQASRKELIKKYNL